MYLNNTTSKATMFAAGAGTAMLAFSVLYLLATVLSIDPLTIPGVIPIEVMVGFVGMAVVVVATLVRIVRQRDVTPDEPTTQSGEALDKDSGGNLSAVPETAPQSDTSGEVNVEKRANVSNGDISPPDERSSGPSDQSDTSAAIDHQSTTNRCLSSTAGSEEASNPLHSAASCPKSGPTQTDSEPRDDQDDNGDGWRLPQDYEREQANLHADQRHRD